MALVDYNCKFIYVDVGVNGRAGDAGVFADSALFRGLENNNLHSPHARPPPNSGEGHNNIPYVIVGDDAFPLKKYLMKPYPDRHNASLYHTEVMERKALQAVKGKTLCRKCLWHPCTAFCSISRYDTSFT